MPACAPQSGGAYHRHEEEESEPMALALTIVAIVLASLALGVQLADLRAERAERAERAARGMPAASDGAAMPPAAQVLAGNDNDPTVVKPGITLVRRADARRLARV
jgi:hypothetical protein